MGKFNIVQLTFFFFAACFTGNALATSSLDPALVTMVQTQAQLEMQASLFYQAYAHYFENSKQALHGFAKFFAHESLEEKKHADKLMTYLNQRGAAYQMLTQVGDFCNVLGSGKANCQLPVPSPVQGTLTEAHTAITNAVEIENHVYDQLVLIAKGNDTQLSHFIEHEYLDEQIESIKRLNDLETHLSKVKRHHTGLLMVDESLLEKHREL